VIFDKRNGKCNKQPCAQLHHVQSFVYVRKFDGLFSVVVAETLQQHLTGLVDI